MVVHRQRVRRDEEALAREQVRLRAMELGLRRARWRRLRKLQERHMRTAEKEWDREIKVVQRFTLLLLTCPPPR
jgi:hypothetical protein